MYLLILCGIWVKHPEGGQAKTKEKPQGNQSREEDIFCLTSLASDQKGKRKKDGLIIIIPSS